MIVEKDNGNWKPVNLSITLETQKEYTNFKEMIRHCDTVPDAILAYGSKIHRQTVHDLMYKIYDKLMEE